jgi:DNA-binding NarL/FixJ family response regulator
MRLGIAEDSALFREGLQMQLTRLGLHVPITAATGDELLALAARRPIDAAILDVRMPPTFTDEGLRTAEQLASRHPGLGILILSAYDEIAYATRLFKNGTRHRGYLLKHRVDNAEALRDALERVCDGESVIDDTIIGRLLSHQRHLSKLDGLTDREQLILRHMAEGRSNAGIAAKTNLAEKTVESNIARIFTKLGLAGAQDDNRRVLAVLAWLRRSDLNAGLAGTHAEARRPLRAGRDGA